MARRHFFLSGTGPRYFLPLHPPPPPPPSPPFSLFLRMKWTLIIWQSRDERTASKSSGENDISLFFFFLVWCFLISFHFIFVHFSAFHCVWFHRIWVPFLLPSAFLASVGFSFFVGLYRVWNDAFLIVWQILHYWAAGFRDAGDERESSRGGDGGGGWRRREKEMDGRAESKWKEGRNVKEKREREREQRNE